MGDDHDQTLTRRFRAGEASFVVRCPSNSICQTIEALFVDLAADTRPGQPTEISLTSLRGSHELGLSIEGRETPPQQPDETLRSLVTAVSRLALDADPGRLHIHSAALSLEGQGVLISAPSGTGKTTLAAALALNGWTYVSDEAVALRGDAAEVFGFPKPLTIKATGRHLVPQLGASRVSLDPESETWLVPASSLTAPTRTELVPSVIIILQRPEHQASGTPPSVKLLHPADTVVALMGQTMDAQRFGAETLMVLAKLAASCQCVEMQAGPLGACVALLADLATSTGHSLDVSAITRPDGPHMGWRVDAHTHSVVIGTRAVAYDSVGGAIAALDEAGTMVWRALHGEAPDKWQPETMSAPETHAFMGTLESHGLITGEAVGPASA